MSIKDLWGRLSPSVREHVVSAAHTFIAVGITALGVQLVDLHGTVPTKMEIITILSSVLRTSTRSVVKSLFVPPDEPSS